MNYILGNAVIGLPSLIGVILGLKLYAAGCRFAIYPAFMFVGPLVLLIIAKSIIHKMPRLAWAFIEIWILAAVAVTAFATAVVTWVSLDTPINQIFNTPGLSADQTKGISGVFVGAVSTYVALVWTKDIGDAQGAFWPSTQFKDAMDKAFHRLQPPPGNTTKAYQAIYQNTVDDYGNIGWGFRARLARANVLAAYIRQLPN